MFRRKVQEPTWYHPTPTTVYRFIEVIKIEGTGFYDRKPGDDEMKWYGWKSSTGWFPEVGDMLKCKMLDDMIDAIQI